MISPRALTLSFVGGAAVLAGCQGEAMAVCHKLEANHVASNCRAGVVPSALPLSDASRAAAFDMRDGGKGDVFVFESEAIFQGALDGLRRDGELGKVSKNGVSMHQGYAGARAMVVLDVGANQDDERGTRLALGQKP